MIPRKDHGPFVKPAHSVPVTETEEEMDEELRDIFEDEKALTVRSLSVFVNKSNQLQDGKCASVHGSFGRGDTDPELLHFVDIVMDDKKVADEQAKKIKQEVLAKWAGTGEYSANIKWRSRAMQIHQAYTDDKCPLYAQIYPEVRYSAFFADGDYSVVPYILDEVLGVEDQNKLLRLSTHEVFACIAKKYSKFLDNWITECWIQGPDQVVHVKAKNSFRDPRLMVFGPDHSVLDCFGRDPSDPEYCAFRRQSAELFISDIWLLVGIWPGLFPVQQIGYTALQGKAKLFAGVSEAEHTNREVEHPQVAAEDTPPTRVAVGQALLSKRNPKDLDALDAIEIGVIADTAVTHLNVERVSPEPQVTDRENLNLAESQEVSGWLSKEDRTLPKAARQSILVEWAETEVEKDENVRAVQDLIEELVEKTPKVPRDTFLSRTDGASSSYTMSGDLRPESFFVHTSLAYYTTAQRTLHRRWLDHIALVVRATKEAIPPRNPEDPVSSWFFNNCKGFNLIFPLVWLDSVSDNLLTCDTVQSTVGYQFIEGSLPATQTGQLVGHYVSMLPGFVSTLIRKLTPPPQDDEIFETTRPQPNWIRNSKILFSVEGLCRGSDLSLKTAHVHFLWIFDEMCSMPSSRASYWQNKMIELFGSKLTVSQIRSIHQVKYIFKEWQLIGTILPEQELYTRFEDQQHFLTNFGPAETENARTYIELWRAGTVSCPWCTMSIQLETRETYAANVLGWDLDIANVLHTAGDVTYTSFFKNANAFALAKEGYLKQGKPAIADYIASVLRYKTATFLKMLERVCPDEPNLARDFYEVFRAIIIAYQTNGCLAEYEAYEPRVQPKDKSRPFGTADYVKVAGQAVFYHRLLVWLRSNLAAATNSYKAYLLLVGQGQSGKTTILRKLSAAILSVFESEHISKAGDVNRSGFAQTNLVRCIDECDFANKKTSPLYSWAAYEGSISGLYQRNCPPKATSFIVFATPKPFTLPTPTSYPSDTFDSWAVWVNQAGRRFAVLSTMVQDSAGNQITWLQSYTRFFWGVTDPQTVSKVGSFWNGVLGGLLGLKCVENQDFQIFTELFNHMDSPLAWVDKKDGMIGRDGLCANQRRPASAVPFSEFIEDLFWVFLFQQALEPCKVNGVNLGERCASGTDEDET